MEFRLTIDCDNAAFGDDEQERADEVARILLDLLHRLTEESGTAHDSNGNTVGKWSFEN